MKLLLTLAACAALTPVVSEKLAFGPKEGTKLEREFEFHMEFSKKSMTMTMGGHELPKELGEQATMEFAFKQQIEVEDELRKLGDGRPALLARHFTKLTDENSSTVQMVGMEEPKEESKSKESKLEGKHVLFRWDDDKDEYAKEWEGEKGDDELLEGLKEDMDLRQLLPEKAVAEGDTWAVDLKEFGALFGPGGDLGFEDDDKDDDDDFEKNLKGAVKCTFKGVEEVEGRKLARITAVCKASSFMDKDEDGGSKMRMELEFDLEGEFSWDVEGRCFTGYELGGETTGVLTLKQEIDIGGGQTHELDMHVELAGKVGMKGVFRRL